MVEIVLIHLTLGIRRYLLAFTSEYMALFPNYVLDFLRAKTVFYTYHDLTFWTFWNSCVSDRQSPNTRKWVLIFDLENMLIP